MELAHYILFIISQGFLSIHNASGLLLDE